MASKFSVFLSELKRRKVYRVSAAYVAVGTTVVVAAHFLLVEVYELGTLPVRVVLALVVLGFPIALILAWAYELRPEEPTPAEPSREEPDTSSEPIPPTPVAPAEQRKSIVVLPFDNLSPDPGDAYFSDGLTEEVITNLSQLKSLRVTSRNSAMALKGSRKSTREIAGELDVQYVLEGSVRRAGNDLRITAQLIRADTDEHLWAEKYNGVLDDVFGIQESVSRAIAEALDLSLSTGEKEKLAERPIEDLQAYDLYLKARQDIYHVTWETMERGIKTLLHGLKLFPDNALLTAMLGEAYYLQSDTGMVTDEGVLDRAEEFAKRSLSLDPDSAQGRKLLGLLERNRGSLIEACRHMKAAHDADPNDPGILMYTAAFLEHYVGQAGLAAPLWTRLFEIDPLTPVNWLFAAWTPGDPEESVRMIQRAKALAPDLPWLDYWIGHFLAVAGRRDEAKVVLEQALSSDFPDPVAPLTRFLKCVISSDEEGALEALDPDTRAFAWADPDFSYIFPGYFSFLGKTEEALAWIRHAADRDFINYPYLAETGPFLENLRSDRRFLEFLDGIRTKWEAFELE